MVPVIDELESAFAAVRQTARGAVSSAKGDGVPVPSDAHPAIKLPRAVAATGIRLPSAAYDASESAVSW